VLFWFNKNHKTDSLAGQVSAHTAEAPIGIHEKKWDNLLFIYLFSGFRKVIVRKTML
jgi:hypothetical protein